MLINCLIYAVALYRRRKPPKGTRRRRYLTLRRSDHVWWLPHVLYAELRRGRWRFISYKPIKPVACPAPFFAGQVCWGDAWRDHD